MSQMVARESSGLTSAPLMLTCFLLLPNNTAVSIAHCIPVKEGVRFPEGLAQPLQPCCVSLCACREPATVCCLC